MTILMNFLTILAWVAAVCGGLWSVFAIAMNIRYEGSLEQMQDRLRGVRTSYPAKKATIVFVIATAFLIAKAMS
jgi:hypothetical protein